MLDSILVRDFKRFKSFSVRLRRGNILVGPNNSGKSSILDAFRILDACYRQARHAPKPLTIEKEGIFYGYEFGHSVLPVTISNIASNYGEIDAVLEFKHQNGQTAIIRLHPDRNVRFYIRSLGKSPKTGSAFQRMFPLDIVVVPTLSPLEQDERWVEDETVRKNAKTRLASRHLRNSWLRSKDEDFCEFRKDVENAWPGVVLHKPEMRRESPPIVEMFFDENRILREVQWAGFGFQVWLQIQTHLRRGDANSLLILDEPDVYLHPDLQRKLLRAVRSRFGQFVMATHSTELVNDAAGDEIISVNSKYKSGKRINSEEEYAKLLRYIGSSENADFARIVRSKKLIFVEGRDRKIISKFAKVLNLKNLASEDAPPVISLGGFTGSPKAAHTIWAFREVLELEISAMCILDSDFRPSAQNGEYEAEMNKSDLRTFVLKREDHAIHRAICSRLDQLQRTDGEVSLQTVQSLLDEAMNEKYEYVTSQLVANELRFARERKSALDDSNIVSRTMSEVNKNWKIPEQRKSLVPGKDVFARLNELLQERYGISLSDSVVIKHMTAQSMDNELKAILFELDTFCMGS